MIESTDLLRLLKFVFVLPSAVANESDRCCNSVTNALSSTTRAFNLSISGLSLDSCANTNSSLINNNSSLILTIFSLSFFNCKICYKTYTARNSLWYHEKKCSIQTINLNETNTVIENDVNLKELFKFSSDKSNKDVCLNSFIKKSLV